LRKSREVKEKNRTGRKEPQPRGGLNAGEASEGQSGLPSGRRQKKPQAAWSDVFSKKGCAPGGPGLGGSFGAERWVSDGVSNRKEELYLNCQGGFTEIGGGREEKKGQPTKEF